MITGDERTAKVVVEADTDDYVKNIKKSADETSKLSKGLDTLSKKMDGLTKRTGNKMMLFGAADIAGLSAMSAIAGTLEKQMSTIEGTAANINASLKGFQKFDVARTESAIRATSRDLPVTRGEVARTTTAITKMGITDSASVNKLTPEFVKMGAATGESGVGLAQGQISLSRQMGDTSVRNIKRQDNVAAGLGAQAGVSATGIMDFAGSLSGSARMAGIDQTDLLGISTAFSRSGADGLYASNTFNKIINEISNMQETGSPEIRKYANAIGVSRDEASNMKPLDIFQKIINEVSNSGERGTVVMENLGLDGARAQRAIQSVSAEGGVDKWIDEARKQYDAPEGEGAVDIGAGAAFGGLFDEMAILRNQFTDLGQVLGSTVLPAFKGVAKLANTLMGIFQPVLEVGAKIAGIGGLAAGGAALAGGAVLKNWAGVSTPALAKRMVGSSYLAHFRGGMETGTNEVSGKFSDNESLRQYSQKRLGPIQRMAFRAGTGAGAYNQEIIGGRDIHPLRIPGNLAMMGADKAGSWLSKGAQDFYADTARTSLDMTKDKEETRVGAFRQFGRNFNTGRKSGLGGWLFGDQKKGPLDGQYKDPTLDPSTAENQTVATAQGVKTQKAFNERVRFLRDKMGAGASHAADLARSTVGVQKLTPEEVDAAKAKLSSKVDSLKKSIPGLSTKEAEKHVIRMDDEKAFEEQKKVETEKEDAKTPWGRLKGALEKLTSAINKLTNQMRGSKKGQPAPGESGRPTTGGTGDPGISEDDIDKQSKIKPDTKPDPVKKPTWRDNIRRANDEPMGKHFRRTSATLGKGIAGTGIQAAKSTFSASGAAAGAGMGALGGPVGLGIMAATAAAGAVKSFKSTNDAKEEVFASGKPLSQMFNDWNKALTDSVGAINSFSAALDSSKASSSTPEAAFTDADRANKAARDNKEFEYEAIDLIGKDKDRVADYIVNQRPSGDTGDKLAADVVRMFGETEGAEINSGIAKRISNGEGTGKAALGEDESDALKEDMFNSWGGEQENIGFLQKAVSGNYGGKSGALSIVDTMSAGILPLGILNKVNQAMGGSAATDLKSVALESVFGDENSHQSKMISGILGEEERKVGIVKDSFDSGEDDEVSNAYAYNTTRNTIRDLASRGDTAEDKATLVGYMQGFKGTSRGAGMEASSSDIRDLTDLDPEERNKKIDEYLRTSDVGKSVDGMTNSELDDLGTVEKMTETQMTAAGKAFVKDIEGNNFYKDMASANRDAYIDFAKDVTTDEDVKEATGKGRNSEASFTEAVDTMVQMVADSGDANLQKAVLQTQVSQYGADTREGQLASAAIGRIGFTEGLETSTRNRMGKFNKTTEDLESYITSNDPNKTDNYSSNVTKLEQARDKNITELYQATQQFERSQSRFKEDFARSRAYSVEDFNESMGRSSADFYKQQGRAYADFATSVERQQEDFNRNRLRSDADYTESLSRQIQQGSTSVLGGPTSRQFGKSTNDAGNIIENLDEQNEIMRDQKKQVKSLMKRGLSQDAVDALRLGDPENWQQTEELFETITGSEIKEINRSVGGRGDALKGLTQDETTSTSYRWSTKDRKKAQKREDEDFARGQDRQSSDFAKSMGRQESDFGESMGRRQADFNKSLARSEGSHQRSLKRMLEDWKGFGTEAGDSMEKVTDKLNKALQRMGLKSLKSSKKYIADLKAAALEAASLPNDVPEGIKKPKVGNDGIPESIRRPDSKKFPSSLFDPTGGGNRQPSVSGGSGSSRNRGGRGGQGRPRPAFAKGGIVTGPITALIGEAGNDEMVVPLDKVGVNWLVEAFSKHDDNKARRGLGVAGKGMSPSEGKAIMNVINNNNVFRDITVVAQDPDKMAKALKHKARMKSLRSGSREK